MGECFAYHLTTKTFRGLWTSTVREVSISLSRPGNSTRHSSSSIHPVKGLKLPVGLLVMEVFFFIQVIFIQDITVVEQKHLLNINSSWFSWFGALTAASNRIHDDDATALVYRPLNATVVRCILKGNRLLLPLLQLVCNNNIGDDRISNNKLYFISRVSLLQFLF